MVVQDLQGPLSRDAVHLTLAYSLLCENICVMWKNITYSIVWCFCDTDSCIRNRGIMCKGIRDICERYQNKYVIVY